MLSAQTLAIVKSTAKFLEENGETLTRTFYRRMFTHNPEVIPFFNQAHQNSGSQPKALATAVAAYAANIDNLGVLTQAVETIAQKHAALRIKAEHYPIVGANLLATIDELLGAHSSPAIIEAWREAYQFLADILIKREAEIYRQQSHMPGGWDGFKTFKVIRKVPESTLITSFYLVPSDGSPLPLFKAGQYITVQVPTPNGSSTMRNYSLSNKPGQGWLRISVKRETGNEASSPAGYVSTLLHQTIGVGSELQLAPPCGEFYLEPTRAATRPLVFLAGGVGITPLLSMVLTTLDARPDQELVLIHACIDKTKQAFRQEIDQLSAQHPRFKIHYRYSDPSDSDVFCDDRCSQGVVDRSLIEAMVSNVDADYYCCGPRAFMAHIKNILQELKIAPEQLHYEFFGPKESL